MNRRRLVWIAIALWVAALLSFAVTAVLGSGMIALLLSAVLALAGFGIIVAVLYAIMWSQYLKLTSRAYPKGNPGWQDTVADRSLAQHYEAIVGHLGEGQKKSLSWLEPLVIKVGLMQGAGAVVLIVLCWIVSVCAGAPESLHGPASTQSLAAEVGGFFQRNAHKTLFDLNDAVAILVIHFTSNCVSPQRANRTG